MEQVDWVQFLLGEEAFYRGEDYDYEASEEWQDGWNSAYDEFHRGT